jgi:hypothetical protein
LTYCTNCSNNLILDSSHKCTCPIELKFYESSSNSCQDCPDLCIICQNLSRCTSCVENAVFDPISNICKCKERFYKENKECKPCLEKCATCLNGFECKTCP